MTNQKNTDNNNPKSDVALWRSHTSRIFVPPFAKIFKTPFHYSENIYDSNFVFVCSK